MFEIHFANVIFWFYHVRLEYYLSDAATHISNCCKAAREDELTQLSLRWASLLQVGRTSSSHSYCFPLELLEPLRMLGCAEYALESFNSLSVKFIQVLIAITME